MKNDKKPLIVIAGPTASGKTEISIRLAKKINGEIISGDSMQVYKKLDIGTAKITKDEMESIPHHLINIIDPADDYNVCIFQKTAKKIIEDIHSRGKVPILVGGTGLYIDSLIYDYTFINQENDTKVREELWKAYHQYGNEYLFEKLKNKDPKAVNLIDSSNTKRLIRALEVIESNLNFSDLERDSRTEKESSYELFYFLITMNRNVLYDRINRRVELMFKLGWLDEVKELINKDPNLLNYRSMQGIGYKQIAQYLNQELTYEECLEKIKQKTRKFAKRQLTWFRKNKDIIILDKDIKTVDELLLEMGNIICQKI